MPWELSLLIPVDDALETATPMVLKNYREWMHTGQTVYLCGDLMAQEVFVSKESCSASGKALTTAKTPAWHR
jgi:hypothetical protein